jgi:hypothetical protein
VYQTPTTTDFQRNLADILRRTREEAHSDEQRVRVEHAARGLSQSGPLLDALAERFDELHAEAVESTMHLIRDFVARMQFPPKELTDSARPILETIAAELVAQVPFLGHESLNRATEQTRARCRHKFMARLEGALRDIEIGFVGGQNMVAPLKDADRRAVILRKFYDERHIRSWVGFPVDPNVSPEERLIIANICCQLHDGGLIEWKTPARGLPEGMGRITNLGVDVVEGNTSAPIAISIDRRISVSGSTHVQIGDSNVQDLHLNAGKIVSAINQSTITASEKEEAKSLLRKLLDNTVLCKVLGSLVGS